MNGVQKNNDILRRYAEAEQQGSVCGLSVSENNTRFYPWRWASPEYGEKT